MISDQRIAELMGWSANPAHVTGVLGGGPDDLPARVRAVAQAAEHRWDGTPVEEDGLWTTTCSRCGMWAFSHSMRTGG